MTSTMKRHVRTFRTDNKNYRMRRLVGILFTLLGVSTLAVAQDNSCGQKLLLAQSVYDEGRLQDIEGLLANCLETNGFTDQEKVEAYKILTLTHIYLEEPEKADEAMLKILQTNPYFQINEGVDPPEFIALYKTFRTRPIYRLGARLGSNGSLPNVAARTSVVEGSSQYSSKINFSTGLVAEVPLDSNTLNASNRT